MEAANTVVYPPNKQFEREIELSKVPHLYDFLLFLDFNANGECILGSSNINGTLWEGCNFYYKNKQDLLKFVHKGFYINSTSSDGKFLNEDTIVLAEDSGILNILKILDEPEVYLQSVDYYKHYHRIPQVAVWDNSNNILSCSGRDVAVWDTAFIEKKPVQTYENYHGDLVNSVDTFKKDPYLFVSASQDRKASIWDQRLNSPANVLYQNEFSALTSIVWNQNNDNSIIVATEAGDIYLLDRREPKEFISVFHCFDNTVHHMAFSNNKVAVCGDLNELLVITCDNNSLKKVYNNCDHKNFVRGLSWNGDELFTCGFDKQVLQHKF